MKQHEQKKGPVNKRKLYEKTNEHVEGMKKLLREMMKIRKKYPSN
jgi:uncharacterized protein YutE (UPF0331/DUF86 family)